MVLARIESNNKLREYPAQHHYSIYYMMMELTDNDHEISNDAASWCELASPGEIYDFREGTISIIERWIYEILRH